MEEEEDGSLPLMEPALPFDRQAKQLYPVSITWQPPFTMLVDLKGHGDLQAWPPASRRLPSERYPLGVDS